MAVRDRIERQEDEQEGKRQRLRTLRDYYRRQERFGAVSAEEDRDREVLEAEDLADRLKDIQRELSRGTRGLVRSRTIIEELSHLLDLAEQAKDNDPKLREACG
jgi:hypothetical protein